MEAAMIVLVVAFVLVLILLVAARTRLPTYRKPDKRGRSYIAGEPGAYLYVAGSSHVDGSSSSDCGSGSSSSAGCDGGGSS